jgi:hypothetical protein
MALLIVFVLAIPGIAHAQTGFTDTTRFTITGAPSLSSPRGEFRQNVGRTFGGGGGVLYRLDRTGWLSVRFDVAGLAYGHEKKRVPFSETIGSRVLVDSRTTNWITSLAVGPELALPRGPLRPYLSGAFSGLFFKTRSSVDGSLSTGEALASTTNHSDRTRAWVVGTGVRIPLPRSDSPFSLDFGVRYHHGGQVSYLREGSIQDNADGTISFTPLSTRTPYVAYTIGFRFNIPFNSTSPCPRFLC